MAADRLLTTTFAGWLQVWAAYSPVKNSPADALAKVAGGTPSHSATTGELDIYEANCKCARRKIIHHSNYQSYCDDTRLNFIIHR